jgi:hypothetical protein
VMKPKPFSSLNHFTVPVVRIPYSLCCADCRGAVNPYQSDRPEIAGMIALPHQASAVLPENK